MFTVYYFYSKISTSRAVLSIRIVLGSFSLLTFYSEKFSTWNWRLPFAVNVTLNLSINPLSPNSDQQQFSPNNLHTMSRDKVVRIWKMITNEKMPWCFIKFSQLILKGNVWRSVWRICTWILGLKGLRNSFDSRTTRKYFLVKVHIHGHQGWACVQVSLSELALPSVPLCFHFRLKYDYHS